MVAAMSARLGPKAPAAGPPETVPFGRLDVAPADKPALVARLFSGVAARYDLMNDLMSAGVHRLWRRALVAALELKPGAHVLDLAGGTGDIARRILEADDGARGVAVTVCDLTPAMLAEGRRRAWDRGRASGLAWVCAEAARLPFAARSFDACTLAFGLRNMTRPEPALAEVRRVLRPGARFLCLEFSPDVAPALAPVYDAATGRVIPALGEIVAGDREAYQYLVDSIRRFPTSARLAEMIAEAGFAGVRARAFAGGIAALHSAWRA